MIRYSILFLAAFFVAGCAVPISTMSRPDAYYDEVESGQPGGSLFSGDADVLSDAAINTILKYEYSPPALSRVFIAVYGRGWNVILRS